jgi:hypothetical protein
VVLPMSDAPQAAPAEQHSDGQLSMLHRRHSAGQPDACATSLGNTAKSRRQLAPRGCGTRRICTLPASTFAGRVSTQEWPSEQPLVGAPGGRFGESTIRLQPFGSFQTSPGCTLLEDPCLVARFAASPMIQNLEHSRFRPIQVRSVPPQQLSSLIE